MSLWCADVGRGESWAAGRESREKGTVKLSRYCPGLGSCLGVLAGLSGGACADSSSSSSIETPEFGYGSHWEVPHFPVETPEANRLWARERETTQAIHLELMGFVPLIGLCISIHLLQPLSLLDLAIIFSTEDNKGGYLTQNLV